MDLVEFEKIKKLAIVAMVSDDGLLERLVLKGGNAIDLIYHISSRASKDIDFSMSAEFSAEELKSIRGTVDRVLRSTFHPEGWRVFDVTFTEKPDLLDKQQQTFWGGYRIGFKITPESVYMVNSKNIEYLRRTATITGPHNQRVFEIDISKFEYCTGKQAKEIDGYRVYVYSPEMIVLEKIRAVCQQIPDYRDIVKTHNPAARARDFFDIYILLEHFLIDLNDARIKDLLKNIFEAKKVPLPFLKRIKDHREFHRPDFISVANTVKSGVQLEDFDFYFDYVVAKIVAIEF
jgi:predicted nucleotidyltransferase component of viral defense system